MKPALKPQDSVDEQLNALISQYKKDYTQVPVLQEFIQLGMAHERYEMLEREFNELLKWGQQQQHFYFLLATVQEKQGNYTKAAASLHRLFNTQGQKGGEMYAMAVRILPRTGEIHDLQFLLRILEGLLPHDRDNTGLVSSLCETYRMLGRHDEAVKLYRETIARKPYDYSLRFSLSITEMMLSNLTRGFDEYEHRFQLPIFKKDTPFLPWQQWAGEPLKGKKLFLWVEQGVGDMVMWAGLLPWVIEQGAEITCAAYPKMLSLMERSFPQIRFVKRYSLLPQEMLMSEFDYHCPMGNLMPIVLPHYTPSEHGAYLIPDKEAVAKKRAEYLAQLPGAKKLVGVSWHTSAELAWRRNVDLTEMHPLLAEPGAGYVSLQYTQRLDDVDAFNAANKQKMISDLSFLAVDDLDAWATQIAAMDEVISIQNSAVHMAGALGIPAKLLLSAYGSWHWGDDNSSNPWYASVSVFRQQPGQSWKSLARQAARQSKEK